MTHCNGDVSQFKSMVNEALDYFQGNHRNCRFLVFLGTCQSVQIQDKETFEQLKKVYYSYSDVADKYSGGEQILYFSKPLKFRLEY